MYGSNGSKVVLPMIVGLYMEVIIVGIYGIALFYCSISLKKVEIDYFILKFIILNGKYQLLLLSRS